MVRQRTKSWGIKASHEIRPVTQHESATKTCKGHDSANTGTEWFLENIPLIKHSTKAFTEIKNITIIHLTTTSFINKYWIEYKP